MESSFSLQKVSLLPRQLKHTLPIHLFGNLQNELIQGAQVENVHCPKSLNFQFPLQILERSFGNYGVAPILL